MDPARIQRVLLIRPRYLGDVCLTLPALDAIRAANPSVRVAYVVEREGSPLLESDPRVDELIVVRRAPSPIETLKLIGRLRRFAPDVAIDFFCNPRTAVWTRASGARIRVGYPNKGWRSSLYTHHARPRTLSAIGFHLASLEALGIGEPGSPWSSGRAVARPAPEPRLHISEAMKQDALAALAEMGVSPEAIRVGFHPGARWPTRRWAPENYSQLASAFLSAQPAGVALITAGPGEERVAMDIAAKLGRRAHAVTGWPLARFVALQSLCRAFVCGDTGPLHTSVAAGTPTLGVMSRNRPAMFFPYAEERGHRVLYARVECSPCHRDVCADLRCLRRLSPQTGWELLAGMLGVAPSGFDADRDAIGTVLSAPATRARSAS